ncbi:MAG: histidine phosphatase family protein [Enhydrobacter sp.]|nr:histidine phosphatase family protein [Enhydrobacter sp.]
MKMILLLRHAKSAWGDPGLNDIDRPLNRRGERAAEVVADYIVMNAPRPDTILCSTAVRTRQTLAPLVHRLTSPAPPIALEKGLYLASENALLQRLQALPDDICTVLLIGHNEGIGELAQSLAKSGPLAALGALHEKFPTGALAVIRTPDRRWCDLARGTGELVSFVRPRDLLPEQRG